MKEPYMLPDDQCERLIRSEMNAVRMMMAALSVAVYAQEDLKKRLECVPAGNQRMRMAVGSLRSVVNDLIGTISRAQAKQIYGVMKDFEMRLLPKMTPGSTNVVMTKEEGMELIDCAKWKCHNCVEDGIRDVECKLYQLLEATTPMDDYGNDMLCPYAMAEWST